MCTKFLTPNALAGRMIARRGWLLLMAWLFLVGASHAAVSAEAQDPTAVGQEFGVIVGPLTPDIRKELNLKLTEGVPIFEIIGNSRAEKAGLKPRTLITEINHTRVHNLDEFGRLLEEVLPAGNFSVSTWEPASPDNQGQGQQMNFYFVPNYQD